MQRRLVIQTEDLDEEAAAWLGERCEVVRCAPSEQRFGELIGRAAGLVVRTYTRVDEAMLARAPSLKVVGRAGVGLENIDVEACRRRGIEVVHTPEANTSAVAEYVFAMMLDALRPRMYLGGAVCGVQRGGSRPAVNVPDADQWHELRRRYVAARELNELTLGIWGLGRVGSAVARIASGFGMRVIYNDLQEIAPEQRWGGDPVAVDELLARSDVLSVHVDGRASNRGLVSSAACARMKPTAVFINTSRGFVVDAAALRKFLLANPGAMAMVDVHDPTEPIVGEYALLGLPNARLSPHLASGTAGAKRRMSWVVRGVWEVLEEETERRRDGETK